MEDVILTFEEINKLNTEWNILLDDSVQSYLGNELVADRQERFLHLHGPSEGFYSQGGNHGGLEDTQH